MLSASEKRQAETQARRDSRIAFPFKRNACQISPRSPASGETHMEEPKKSKLPLIIGVVLLLLFAGAYIFVLNAYKNETANRAAELTADTQKAGENHIDVVGRIVTVDPIKGDVVVRLEFTPKGSLGSADGATLARDLDLYVASSTGKNVHEFKKGKRMNPVEAVFEIYEGEVMDYPFDTHTAEIGFFFEPPVKGGESGGSESVPMAVELRGSVAGLRIDAEYAKENTPDHAVIEVNVQRASTAVFFSVFIMIAMWALTIGVLCLVFRVFAGHRKIEISMFSFLGALLFAFPALRNSQPGTPPIGTMSDFLAFFWAEVIIALSLLSVVLRWIIRGAGGDAK
ncbi:MAG: hypothetical protein DLM73_01350 [Chthoniobacterales bacterium]|nr:MAG: hypothetical protein DLM73_01350 [Chthoniobacterales bacterium]